MHKVFWTGLASLAVGTITIDAAVAQVRPDATLGAENSRVRADRVTGRDGVTRDSDVIEGGAQRSGNLFHSFEQFDVPEGRGAYFGNPADVQNIFSRVTGADRSEIFGTLGVLGNANLFFLNPNGILFGPNASLDIQGSFVGTTANGIWLGNQGFFSATTPEQSNLLEVNPGALFFNQVAAQGGSITSSGNLAAGQDLTLAGQNLDLQGRVVAGRDLTLQAQDTLRIRDSVTTPFVAASGGTMLVQGNQAVDIFALNHPNSGLVSDGDMVLRSGNTVSGDAHYWSGGDFRIEQLDGNLGDLYSPYDPIIRVVGDLEFANYSGASLHILAGGSVAIPGYVLVVGSDATGAALVERVRLTDETVLAIDGTIRPTVDIRAGVEPAAIGTPLGVTGEGSFPGGGTIFDAATSADISVGYIRIASPNGLVYLTNQYQPNNVLAGGDIAINQPGFLGTLRGINTRSDVGNGGSVVIDSRNSIISPSEIRTASSTGNSGDIKLLAARDIALTDEANINANTTGVGDAGNILINANGTVLLSGAGAGIRSNVTSDNLSSGGVGQGGTVTIRSGSLALSDQTIIDVSTFGRGNAGKVFIDVDGAVALESGSFIYNNVEENAIGSTGGIEIYARSLALSNGSQIVVSNVGGNGNLGDVFIDTTDSVSLRGVFNPLIRTAGTAIGNRLDSGSAGAGGNIIINTGSLLISGANISTSTFGTGNAGNVFIDARDSVSLAANSGISSTVDSGAVGNGGRIQIKADSLSLNQSALQAIVRGSSGGLPAGRGNSGNITVNLRGDLEIMDNDDIPIGVGILTSIAEGVTEAATPGVTPVAGNISVSAGNLSISGQNAQLRSTLDLYSTGQAGNIDVEARSLTLSDRAEITTGTSGQGNAGNISIDVADSAVLATNANIYSGVSRGANGNGGSISFEAGSLSVTGGAQFLTTLDRRVGNVDGETIVNLPLAQGNAGNININVRGITTLDGGEGNSPNSTVPTGILSDAPSEIGGTGGDISIRSGSLVFRNGARLSSETNGIGRAGNISINSGQLTLSNNARVSSSTTSNASAGSVSIESRQLELSNDSLITTSTSSNGNSGDIRVNSDRLTLRNGSSLLTDALTGTGKAGNLIVNATESVDIVGTSLIDRDSSGVPDASGLYAQTRGAGDAGDLRVTTGSLSIRDGGTISAETSGSGQGGNLTVDASEAVEIVGGSPEQSFSSSITAGVENNASGDAGDVTVNTNQLTLRDGGFIASSAESNSTGNAGDVAVNANSIELVGISLDKDNPTGISVAVEPGATGNVGDVTIATQRLNLRDGASILAQNLGSGQSGAIRINATDSIVVEGDGEATLINAVSGSDAIGQPGSIRLQTQDLRLLNGGQIVAATFGRVNAGNIQVQADDLIEISGTSTDNLSPSGISAISIPLIQGNVGQGGNIDVRARVLRLREGGEISASTFGQADAGNISLNVSNFILLDRGTLSTTVNPEATGNGGDIAIRTGRLNLQNRSNITSSTAGTGDTGSITVTATDGINLRSRSNISNRVETGATGNSQQITLTTPNLDLRGESAISAATNGNGSAGDIRIQNADTVSLSNSRISTEVQRNAVVPVEVITRSQPQPRPNSNQGNITIEADRLHLDNGAAITASTNGQGRAGNVRVNHANQINLNDNSTISSAVGRHGQGRGGNVTLETDSLNLNDSRITANTNSQSRAGNIRVNANSLEATNGNISANTNRRGQGGTIDLNTQNLSLNDGATISTTSQRQGRAGNISITAVEQLQSADGNITTSANRSNGGNIRIRGGDLDLTASSNIRTDVEQGNGNGGDITVNADAVRLQDNSDIQTRVGDGGGNGGDITVNADSVIAFDDSDIITEAPQGQGGDITLNTPAFFGSGYQPNSSTGNADGNGRVDLDASGSVSAGTVQTPDTSFIQNSLSDLPNNAIDTENLLANSCIARTENGGVFLITGTGGLPPNRPSSAPLSPYPTDTVRTETEPSWQPGDPIVEPQGVYRLPNGELFLGHECPQSQQQQPI